MVFLVYFKQRGHGCECRTVMMVGHTWSAVRGQRRGHTFSRDGSRLIVPECTMCIN